MELKEGGCREEAFLPAKVQCNEDLGIKERRECLPASTKDCELRVENGVRKDDEQMQIAGHELPFVVEMQTLKWHLLYLPYLSKVNVECENNHVRGFEICELCER